MAVCSPGSSSGSFLSRDSAKNIQARASFDAMFIDTIELENLREEVLLKYRYDIGFDAGAECYSPILGVRLLVSCKSKNSRLIARCDAMARTFQNLHWKYRYRMFHAPSDFAADTDCSALALTGLYEGGYVNKAALLRGAAELLKSAAPAAPQSEPDPPRPSYDEPVRAGVVMVYWEDDAEPGVKLRGKKQDPAVACNVLYALKLATRLADPNDVIAKTLDYVEAHLRESRYCQGTRYYPSPDTFLCFAALLCARFADCQQRLGWLVQEALLRRSYAAAQPGHPGDPRSAVNLAQRIIAANKLGVDSGQEAQRKLLVQLQRENGTWAAGPIFSLGKQRVYFGSSALTTLLALVALER